MKLLAYHKQHVFDNATNFCVKCGAAEKAIREHPPGDCPGGGNVIGISHLVCGKRLRDLALENAVFEPHYGGA